MERQYAQNALANVIDVPIYVFKFHDPGNNELQSDNPSLPTFQLATTKGFMDVLKQTTLVCTTNGDTANAIRGEINWKDKKITVAGVTKAFSEAKHRTGGFFDLGHEWTWPSGKYTTTYKSRIWTIQRGGEVLAVYTPYKVKAFSKDEKATLKFLVDVPNEEKVFLIFAIMFSDLRLPPSKPKTGKEVAGEVAAGAAVNVATNVLTNCCVVQ